MCKNRPVKTGTPAEVATAMEAALDEVAAQIVSLPIRELVEEEELEWSFDAPGGWSLLVEGERGEPTKGVLPVLLTVHARHFFLHDELARAVTAPLDG